MPVAVKAQLPVSSRGKAGAVIRAESPADAANAFDLVTSIQIDGLQAVEACVEPWQALHQEVYLAVTFDPRLQAPVLLFNSAGGVDVESQPNLLREFVLPDPSELSIAHLRDHVEKFGLSRSMTDALTEIAHELVRAFFSLEARTIELNPLGWLQAGGWMAIDARVVLDDNALFRQPELKSMVESMQPRRAEDAIRDATRLEYVPLDGTIGVISGGAGMTMAVMDLIGERGASAACFLDCSADVTPRGYRAALDIVMAIPGVTSILVSVFGGLTRVDRVASTFVDILAEKASDTAFTFRLMGTNLDEADHILTAAGLHNHRTLEAAVDAAVAAGLARGDMAS
jgi:succinyl-CoA synthetase beta subunit